MPKNRFEEVTLTLAFDHQILICLFFDSVHAKIEETIPEKWFFMPLATAVPRRGMEELITVSYKNVPQ